MENRRKAEEGLQRRGRAGFVAACAVYGAWLIFLAVLAVMQKMR